MKKIYTLNTTKYHLFVWNIGSCAFSTRANTTDRLDRQTRDILRYSRYNIYIYINTVIIQVNHTVK